MEVRQVGDELRYERRMSDADALMWGIEKDPLLRSTITAIALLDGPPDKARLLDKLERGSRLIPRLRQKAVGSPLVPAPPRWVVDPHFDLDYHVRWLRAPEPGDLRTLLDLAAPIAMQGFDRARPLWEFFVVEGLQDDQAALIQKIHHSVTDGVGAVKIAMLLLDLTPDEDGPGVAGLYPDAPEAEHLGAVELVTDALRHEARRQLGIAKRTVGRVAKAAADPVGSARAVADLLGSAGRVMAPAFQPMSQLMSARSLSVRFDTITAPLSETQAAAMAAGGKLNDAFVAAVAGGLRRYHDRHGVQVDALRMGMPINIRGDDTLDLAGNKFVPMRFLVPMTIADPRERMRVVRRLVGEQRAEPVLASTDAVAGVLNRLPTTMVTRLFGSMLKGVDFTTSNVPGVPMPVYLCGPRLVAQYPFGPLSGAATNITLLSYLDDLHIGINTDRAAVPDPDVLVECLEEGFAEVRKAG
jgi:WS/DGAT/MGAT family acyltransferase